MSMGRLVYILSLKVYGFNCLYIKNFWPTAYSFFLPALSEVEGSNPYGQCRQPLSQQ